MYKVAVRVEGGRIPWEEGCPVVLEAVQVSRDAERGEAYLQARVRNVGARRIEYLRVETTLSLSGGEAVEAAFEYFDLSVKPGESAPLPAQPMEWVNVVGVEAKASAAKTDSSEWESAGPGGAVPEGGGLLVLSPELLAERRRLFEENGLAASHADYAVRSGRNWWVCACGQLNVRRTSCLLCRAERGFLEKTEDAQFLRQSAERRAADAEEAEEEARRAEEARRERGAKARRGLRIAVPVAAAVVVVAAAAAIVVAVVMPRAAFDDAKSEFEAGNYEAAYEKFVNLGNSDRADDWADFSAEAAAEEAMAEADYLKAVEWYGRFGREGLVNQAKLEYVKSHMDLNDETAVEFAQELAEADFENAREVLLQLANVRFETKVVGVGEEVGAGDAAGMPDLGRSFDWSSGQAGGITFAYRIASDIPIDVNGLLKGSVKSEKCRVGDGGELEIDDAFLNTYGTDIEMLESGEWQLQYEPVSSSDWGYSTYRVSLAFYLSTSHDARPDTPLSETGVAINQSRFSGYQLPA